jgi:hypothetical protein
MLEKVGKRDSGYLLLRFMTEESAMTLFSLYWQPTHGFKKVLLINWRHS